MRFMHLADLHIGKKVNGFSMLEDQKKVLEQVLTVAEQQNLDGVILAGDIYDKSVPAGEAVQLLDWFLTELVNLNLEVYMFLLYVQLDIEPISIQLYFLFHPLNP